MYIGLSNVTKLEINLGSQDGAPWTVTCKGGVLTISAPNGAQNQAIDAITLALNDDAELRFSNGEVLQPLQLEMDFSAGPARVISQRTDEDTTAVIEALVQPLFGPYSARYKGKLRNSLQQCTNLSQDAIESFVVADLVQIQPAALGKLPKIGDVALRAIYEKLSISGVLTPGAPLPHSIVANVEARIGRKLYTDVIKAAIAERKL